MDYFLQSIFEVIGEKLFHFRSRTYAIKQFRYQTISSYRGDREHSNLSTYPAILKIEVKKITKRDLVKFVGPTIGTNHGKMPFNRGMAVVFKQAFLVFSRFLSLKSRGCALLETHRQRETTGIKKLYNSFFVMF